MKLALFLLPLAGACHPTTDPALTAAELACVTQADARLAVDACRQKVRLAWAKAHDAGALIDSAPPAIDAHK
jgi:hypothetical protein